MREGIAGPHGGAWGPSTIAGNAARGTGILNNELYLGRLVWNRLRYVKDPSTGKRVSRLNDPAQRVVVEVPGAADRRRRAVGGGQGAPGRRLTSKSEGRPRRRSGTGGGRATCSRA